MKDSVHDRINLLIKSEKETKANFSRNVGITSQNLQNITGPKKNKPSFDLLKKIKDAYPHINMDWLISGEGEMYISRQQSVNNTLNIKSDNNITLEEKVQRLTIEKMALTELLKKFIPQDALGKYKGRKILPLGALEILCTGFSTIGLKTAI